MPNYLNHVLTNFALLIVLFILYQKNPFLSDMQLGLSLFGYFLGSVILNPDLDSSKSKPSQKCGIICKPLTMMSKHRGLQHHWLYGTILRILYVILLISFVLIVFYGLPSVLVFINILFSYKAEIMAFVGGLFISNISHILLDKIC